MEVYFCSQISDIFFLASIGLLFCVLLHASILLNISDCTACFLLTKKEVGLEKAL